jgi:tetratricopeptide (TPR) repeat protein
LGGIGRRVMAEELEKKGNAAFVDEDFEEAVNLYTKALDLDSTNASVYISRAAAHVKLENFTGTYAWRGSSRTAHGRNPRKIEHVESLWFDDRFS